MKIKIPKTIVKYKQKCDECNDKWDKYQEKYTLECDKYAMKKLNLKYGEIVKFKINTEKQYYGIILSISTTCGYSGDEENEISAKLRMIKCSKNGDVTSSNAKKYLVHNHLVEKYKGEINDTYLN